MSDWGSARQPAADRLRRRVPRIALASLVMAVALWLAAGLGSRLVPERGRAVVVAGIVLVGFTVALVFDIYHTPFAADAARTSWAGLFQ